MDREVRELQRAAAASPNDFDLRIRLAVARRRAGIADYELPFVDFCSAENAITTTSMAPIPLPGMRLVAREPGSHFAVLRVSPVYGGHGLRLWICRRGSDDMTPLSTTNGPQALLVLKSGDVVDGMWSTDHGVGHVAARSLALIRLADPVSRIG